MTTEKKLTTENKTVTLSEDEYYEHTESYDGLCLACFEWTCGGVEPDAENYECTACGARKVMGAENALIGGHVEVEG